MNVLRDQVWQFIGAILALIALLATIVVYLKQKPKKLLVWDAQNAVPIVSVHKSVENELEIIFRGRKVREAYFISIILANEGNTPITRDDYDSGIEIGFSEDCEI